MAYDFHRRLPAVAFQMPRSEKFPTVPHLMKLVVDGSPEQVAEDSHSCWHWDNRKHSCLLGTLQVGSDNLQGWAEDASRVVASLGQHSDSTADSAGLAVVVEDSCQLLIWVLHSKTC